MASSNSIIVNSYFGLLNSLSISSKLELIHKLTESIQIEQQQQFSMKTAFGGWESDKTGPWKTEKTAATLINDLRASRNNSRQIESI